MSAPAHRLLLSLLFDEELRERFFTDRDAVTQEHGLAPDDARAFASIDREGLELDAGIRRQYLMSALCRAYPLSSGALGAQEEGPRRLAAFLASPRLLTDPNTRAAAFGDHLRRLVQLNAWKLAPAVQGLLEALVAFERGLVDRAAELRAAIEGGASVPQPRTYSSNETKREPLVLPPFFLAVELPVPTSLVRAALDQISADDAWHRIESGRLQASRFATVARSDAMPVTVLARAVSRGQSGERAGAGGIAPVIDVSHLTAELSGRRGALLSQIDGKRLLNDFAPEDRGLLRQLLEAGLLALAPR